LHEPCASILKIEKALNNRFVFDSLLDFVVDGVTVDQYVRYGYATSQIVLRISRLDSVNYLDKSCLVDSFLSSNASVNEFLQANKRFRPS
jgi:hypothetical protein